MMIIVMETMTIYTTIMIIINSSSNNNNNKVIVFRQDDQIAKFINKVGVQILGEAMVIMSIMVQIMMIHLAKAK